MLRRQLLILILLISLFVVPTLAAPYKNLETVSYSIDQPIPDPRPTIRINFGENPVTVDDYEIRYAKDAYGDMEVGTFSSQAVNPADGMSTDYIFTPDQNTYLLSTDYVFNATATDADGNVVNVIVDFTISSNAPHVYLLNPINKHFEDNTTFAMATKKAFNLTLTIKERPVRYCKEVFLDTYSDTQKDNTPDYIFEHLYAGNDMSTNDGGKTFYKEDFSMGGRGQGRLFTLLIACEEMSGEHFTRQLSIGYDTTPPEITINAQDVTDPTTPKTTINATTDDKSVCTFTNPGYPEQNIAYKIGFEEPTISSEESYKQEDAVEKYFTAVSNSPPASDPPWYYTFNVTCENMAGNKSTESKRVKVEFVNGLDIIPQEPPLYVHDKKVPIVFRTTTRAACTITVDGTEEIALEPDTQDHEAQTSSLDPGTHEYSISCYNTLGQSAERDAEFTIDNEGPGAVNITGYDDYLCGEARIEAKFEAEDEVSGIDHYEYTIKQNGDVFLEENDTDGEISYTGIQAENGDKFVITAKAVDKAGNEGTAKTSGTITYNDGEDPVCDHTSPKTSADTWPAQTGEGITVNITCTDAQSGCDERGVVHSYKTAPDDACDTNTSLYEDEGYRIGAPFTIADNVKLCWYVEDNADPDPNKGLGETVVSGNLGIDLISPRFGISANKTFKLEAKTAEKANCRQGEYDTAYDGRGARALYNTLEAKGNDTRFDTTGGTLHSIEEFDQITSGEKQRTVEWLITCKSSDGKLYGAKKLELGYDTTPPVITVIIDPQDPLIEPNQDHATMTVQTDEDSLCTYLQPTNEPYPLPGMPGQYRYNFNHPQSDEHYDLLNRDDYDQTYSTRIPEDEERYFYTATYTTYPYKVLCTNLAGRSSEETYEVIIDHANTLAVTIGTPTYVNTKRFTVNATTVLEASCDYSIDGKAAQPLKASDQNHYHQASVSLDPLEETYRLTIRCNSTNSQNLKGSAQRDIMIDPEAPSITNITLKEATCGLEDAPQARLQSQDELSGIDHYEYELTIKKNTTTKTTSKELIELPVETPLKEGDTYTIRARAYDKAGNIGAWSPKKTITATDENAEACDEKAPTGWPEIKDTTMGADVIIHCVDDKSGCAQTYGYAFVNDDEDCTEATYRSSASGITGDSYDDPVSVTEDQKLCWQIKDAADNTYTSEQPVDLTVSMGITLTKPRFGIGNEQTYDLTYKTTRAATCKAGFLNPAAPSALKDWYGQLPWDFDTTGGVTHTIKDFSITERGASACSGKDECTTPVVVICEENGRYHQEVDQIGFDTSPPRLTVAEARPNPVRTPGNLQSTLYIQSDDEVWCRYVRNDTGESYAFEDEPDITNPAQYRESQHKSLGYFNPPASGEESYSIDYDINCVNLAGEEAHKPITLTIAPTNEVGITVHNKNAYETRTVTMDVTTDLPATCEYTLNANQPAQAFKQTGSNEHNTSISFRNDGEYEVIITCDATSGPYAESLTHPLTIDATGPKMLEIITQENTCSLETITATLAANASVIGLKEYNYSITDRDGNLLAGWKTATAKGTKKIEEDLTLTQGENYKIQAQAIDAFGRKSTIISKSVTARGANYEGCDEEPPRADLSLEDVYGAVNAYVDCEDDGSGCAQTYDFQYAAESCEPEGYSSARYSDQPQRLESSGKACAIVYDNAGLNDTDSEKFTIIAYCSNGIQDPEEKGIDCGGPCPADCDRCDNGKQDLDEEGVDCGGVCPRSCDQECGNNIVEPGEECDGSAGLTCASQGFTGGSISCSSTCEIDTSACTPAKKGICGNGVVEPGEECDGKVGESLTCEDYGLTSGTLSCVKCKISTTSCEGAKGYCGDGYVGPGETCEKGSQGLSCEDYGLISGTISCADDCTTDTTGCFEGYCGDGEIDRGESCDGLEWGGVAECADISDDFIGGTPVCGADCHFNTNNCEKRPEGSKKDFCLSDDDCAGSDTCVDNKCTATTSSGGEECTLDSDCPEGETCSFGSCNREGQQLAPQKHTLGWSLLIAGMLLILGGAGYLVYTTFIAPPPAPTTAQATGGMPGSQGTAPSREETPQQRAARLAEEKRKLQLQQEAKKKAQEQKEKQRKELLSSFKGDELAKKGAQDQDAAPAKKEAEEQPTPKSAPVKKEAKKRLATAKDEDVFSELETIAKAEEPATMSPKTNDDVFKDLAELSGSSKSKVRTTINNNATSDDLVKLFEKAQRKDVTPKRLTPALKHFISKGKLEHQTAHEVVHKLHEQEKLTQLQKEKILKDLEEIGK